MDNLPVLSSPATLQREFPPVKTPDDAYYVVKDRFYGSKLLRKIAHVHIHGQVHDRTNARQGIDRSAGTVAVMFLRFQSDLIAIRRTNLKI